MAEVTRPVPSFNLWSEPWITVQDQQGELQRMGIAQTLTCAHQVRSLYDPSPLFVASIHRLLVAVLQGALDPQKNRHLESILQAGKFPEDKIMDFGERFANRFDLYSVDLPFLQSADLPLASDKNSKTVAYLTPEIPAGTEVTHFRHGGEQDHVFCSACAAGGLVCIPAFSTAGGREYRPSINGIPPFYVLPGGETLFESLAASLTQPNFQPKVADRRRCQAWWLRQPLVKRDEVVLQVDYLYSLTFPARRVRLHPERLNVRCTRCGRTSEWMVRQMVFKMGESRPKGAELWDDPFVAFRQAKRTGKLVTVRPTEGKATWREFASLFLKQPQTTSYSKTLRPAVLDQIEDLEFFSERPAYTFRCIGMRTDQAKVFEWVESGFDVPPDLLRDEMAAILVQDAVMFASECASIIRYAFRSAFGGRSKKSERHKGLRVRMDDGFWADLAEPFRHFILGLAPADRRLQAQRQWADHVVNQARRAFSEAADAIGDDAETLSRRMPAEKTCHIQLAKKRKEYLHE